MASSMLIKEWEKTNSVLQQIIRDLKTFDLHFISQIIIPSSHQAQGMINTGTFVL